MLLLAQVEVRLAPQVVPVEVVLRLLAQVEVLRVLLLVAMVLLLAQVALLLAQVALLLVAEAVEAVLLRVEEAVVV